jgi:phosphopantetheine adenylyltransferase
MYLLREHLDTLSNRIAIRLIEQRLVETTSKDELENQLNICLRALLNAEDFDIQYTVANVRHVVPRPHFVSLYLTAFIVEKLIEHKTIVDIFGTDDEIYRCVNNEVYRLIPLS